MNTEEPTKFGDIEDEPVEDYFDGIEHSALKKTRKLPRFGFSSITEIPLIIAGIGLVILIVLLAVLIPKDSVPYESADISRIVDRLQEMETRLYRIETAMHSKSDSGEEAQDVDLVRARVSSLESDVLSRFDDIDKKLETYQTQMKALEKPVPVKRRDAGLGKSSNTSQKSQADVYHHVRTGETLYSISRENGLTVDQLKRLNPSVKGKNIYPGQKLRIK